MLTSALWLPMCAGFRAASFTPRTSALRMMCSHARVVVSHTNVANPDEPGFSELANVDKGFASRVVTGASAAHTRLVLSPAGTCTGEMDDIRNIGEAAQAGAGAAIAMGATELTLEVDEALETARHPVEGDGAYAYASLIAQLGVWQRAYVPLQAREASLEPEDSEPAHHRIASLELHRAGAQPAADAASAIEAGRVLARDIGSADPERMAPRRLAEIVRARCDGTDIQVSVEDHLETLQAEYPLLSAVARASTAVERHRPCVVRMSWSGRGAPTRTLLVAGKGVTYDVGGADIKVGGSMAGMRRDKCGAAAAAGFILSCAAAPPELTEGLQVIVELGCVRNSLGSDAFVADEILTSHAGKRVLVGNTDAEGRLVLADVLSHLRARVAEAPDAHPRPTLLSLATLTGHATRSYGAYAAAIDAPAARASGGLAPRLAAAGTLLGEPLEVSMLRRDDFKFVAPGSRGTPVAACGDSYDVLQSNNAPTAVTGRGHQFPMAFLLIASGLMDHGAGSALPLPYCHLDLADSVSDARGVETGSPIVPLFGHFVLGL